MTGETITIAAADDDTDAYVARPDSSSPGALLPGVLFLTDVIGLRPRIEAMADRIASWGYVVLVPHLFHRFGSPADWAPTEDLLLPEARAAFFGSAMPRARTLTPDAVRPDLVAYLDALRSLPGVAPGPIGVTGYCMGGRLALNIAAARPDDVAAVGMFHTGELVTDDHDSPHLHLVGINAFVLAIHADRDRSLPAMAVAQFEHALIGGGVAHSATVYPGAPHGYTMSDLEAYHHEACEHHFTELEALFGRTLSE
ncbi:MULTISPECIES: dienelactone hydrolase family protein [unclassified Gordonia (in: high G+C Gram-positive bacteria)]|uniref:dienelactone hydrolase family protein n=1 Tax=unclassified Gordonia (in: high G+C Gram-positive bacteria) TaxID=2657482 RepID=UPI00027DE9C0|nr:MULTISPECIES: dienelactone hydrolase family protein [unclassified Gordonia (in: high G+C Gram-positive bacteria)]AFR51105.1 Dienelactone hydrolase-related enzyme [Gordonia sp. KTR9]